MFKLRLLDDTLYRTMQLNARYVQTLAKATSEFLRDLASTLGESRAAQRDRFHYPMETQRAPHPQAPPARQSPVVLLEAEAGRTAFGVFLMENYLGVDISARPEASPFIDPPTATSGPHLTFDPEVVQLAPNEQVLVRVLAAVDDTLQPDVRYRCDVTIPALHGTKIPVVIRRRPDRPKETAASDVIPSANAAPEKVKIGKRPRRVRKQPKKGR